MKRVLILTALLALALAPAQAQNYQSLTGTCSMTSHGGYGYFAYTFDWTSAAGGGVTGTIDNLYGELLMVATNPNTSATPTASYDIVLNADDDVDVMQGGGANRSATANEVFAPMVASSQTGSASKPAPAVRAILCGQYSLAISAAGAAKIGSITIYVKR